MERNWPEHAPPEHMPPEHTPPEHRSPEHGWPKNRWLVGLGVGLLATAGLVAVAATSYQIGRDDDTVVVTGTESTEGRIVYSDHGWHGHGWRGDWGFGRLVFPLLIIGAIVLFASRLRRGGGGPPWARSPYPPGAGPVSPDEAWRRWHRHEHERESPTPPPPPPPTSSTPPQSPSDDAGPSGGESVHTASGPDDRASMST